MAIPGRRCPPISVAVFGRRVCGFRPAFSPQGLADVEEEIQAFASTTYRTETSLSSLGPVAFRAWRRSRALLPFVPPRITKLSSGGGRQHQQAFVERRPICQFRSTSLALSRDLFENSTARGVFFS